MFLSKYIECVSIQSCPPQLQALPIGVDRLVLPSEENMKKAYDLANQAPQPEEGGRRKWRKGELEFEGYMRHLDNAVSTLTVWECIIINVSNLQFIVYFLEETWQ